MKKFRIKKIGKFSPAKAANLAFYSALTLVGIVVLKGMGVL